jgi:hypothetical protein
MIAAMKSDLRNLVTSQEMYFADYPTAGYGTLAQLTAANVYMPSTGVAIATSNVSGTGWSASATHVSVAGITCTVAFGAAAGTGASGEPICA